MTALEKVDNEIQIKMKLIERYKKEQPDSHQLMISVYEEEINTLMGIYELIKNPEVAPF